MTIDRLKRQDVGMASQRVRDHLVNRLRNKGISNAAVLAAIATVPRHLFIDEALLHRAYEDDALPIGHGQSISQPYVVAWMTQELLVDGVPDKVLEIGTGSGYQAAVLANIVPAVFSVERISDLLGQAKKRLQQLKINNVMTKHGDGSLGWSQLAPYGAIIVTAAPEQIPNTLLEQLAVGGRMVVPVGGDGLVQELRCIQRTDHGFTSDILGKVSFVPFRSGRA